MLDYFAQVALSKKLKRESLSNDLKQILARNLNDRNSLRNDLIYQLIGHN